MVTDNLLRTIHHPNGDTTYKYSDGSSVTYTPSNTLKERHIVLSSIIHHQWYNIDSQLIREKIQKYIPNPLTFLI